MNRSAYFAWLFLTVWAAWLCALSGYLTQFGWMGRWAPDLGTALFVALAGRAQVSDIAKFAVCLGIARASVSIDTPAAVLAAALGTGALLRIVRSGFQIDNPVLGAGLAFLIAALQAGWLELVHLRTHAVLAADWSDVHVAWRAGISTAIATALFSRVLINLPGLGNLMRRKTWAVGASLR